MSEEELSQVPGTGPGGRITEGDVLDYVAAKAAKPAEVPVVAAPAAEDVLVPVKGIRKIMAERMVESVKNAPQFSIAMEVDMAETAALRTKLVADEELLGVRVSYTDILAYMVGRALEEHPQINARWEGDQIRQLGEINVGIAVGAETGLVVPVVKAINQKRLVDVAREIKELSKKAQAGKLSPDELQGGNLYYLQPGNVRRGSVHGHHQSSRECDFGRWPDKGAADGGRWGGRHPAHHVDHLDGRPQGLGRRAGRQVPRSGERAAGESPACPCVGLPQWEVEGMADPKLVAELEEKAKMIRRSIVEMIGDTRRGHLGGSLSIADMVAVLYYHTMRLSPGDPNWEDRDRFLLSKGHAALAQYAALIDLGYIPQEELYKLKDLGSMTQGHPDMRKTPGDRSRHRLLGAGAVRCGGHGLGAAPGRQRQQGLRHRRRWRAQ